MSRTRLDVRKTHKLYIGGAFVRSESGRALAATSADGTHLDNFCHASRKDLRDAVVAARNAFEGWAKKTAYLKGQILYRAAEMLESRAAAIAEEIGRTGISSEAARAEVDLAIDRLVYFAGWTDKFTQVFGAVNPVATSHFNFTVPEPTGVVVVLPPDEPSFVPAVALLASVILTGNAAIIVASETAPLPLLAFAEILATSDLPGGVANILSGKRAELLPHIAGHKDINAVVDAAGCATVQEGAAVNLKRCTRRILSPEDWRSARGENPYWIGDTVEYKTAWHPIGI
ncbi:MAG TPA: aldehyde dehydrogenase family protein [Verrucomicrobiae bacterium]|nr:aldehyde dehydrogenase family protein [Verrucomicrobiae bacterium]